MSTSISFHSTEKTSCVACAGELCQVTIADLQVALWPVICCSVCLLESCGPGTVCIQSRTSGPVVMLPQDSVFFMENKKSQNAGEKNALRSVKSFLIFYYQGR